MKSILTWITTKLPMRNSRKMNHNQSVYQLIGEINGTRELANTFYDIMEQDPQVQELLAIHPLPLDNVRENFTSFYLVG